MSLKNQLSILLFVVLALPAWGQQRPVFVPCDEELRCQDFAKILAATLGFLDQKDGANAYLELKALEACDKCPEHREALDALSDEIIGLFRQQNEALEEVLAEQTRTLNALEKRTRDLNREQQKVARQLVINEKMTKDALLSGYLSRAEKYYARSKNGDFTGTDTYNADDALWLTDFAYTYLDSTHKAVRQLLYQMFFDQLIQNLPPDYFESAPEMDATEPLPAGVASASWSPDQQWLAVGLDNGLLTIFAADGQMVFNALQSQNSITNLAWNSTAKILAFNISDGVGFLGRQDEGWTSGSDALTTGETVYALRWSPVDPELFAAAGDNKRVNIYRYQDTGAALVVKLPDVHSDWVRDLAWSPDGRKMVAGDDNGYVMLYQVDPPAVISSALAHADYVRTVDWRPDGQAYLSGSDDYQLLTWDTLGQVLSRDTFPEWVMYARYTASGQSIGLLTNDNAFYWRTATGAWAQAIVPDRVHAFAWRGEENTTGSPAGGVLDFDAAATFHLAEAATSVTAAGDNPALQPAFIAALKWSPDGEYLAYAKEDGLFLVGQDSIHQFTLDGSQIAAITWHPGLSPLLPNANFFATVDSYNRLIIWDAATLTIFRTIDLATTPLTVAWSPNGQFLAVGDVQGGVRIFDNQLVERDRFTLHNDYVRSVSWSPDSQWLATGSDDRTCVVWDVEKQVQAAVLDGHVDWIRAVQWLSNDCLATAGDDQKTIIWKRDKNKGAFQISQELPDSTGYQISLAYAPGSSQSALAVGTTQGDIKVWTLDQNFKATFGFQEKFNESISALDWHPRSGELTASQIGTLPLSINSAGQRQTPYDGADKLVKTYSFADARYGYTTKIADYFYLPDLELAGAYSNGYHPYNELFWTSDDHLLAAITWTTAQRDTTQLEVHDMLSHQLSYRYQLADGNVIDAQFSPDNKYLAVLGDNQTVSILEAAHATDTIFFTLVGSAVGVLDWTWSADSRFLSFITQEYTLYQFDVQRQQLTEMATGLQDNPMVTLLLDPNSPQTHYFLTEKGIYTCVLGEKPPNTLVYQLGDPTTDCNELMLPQATWLAGGQQMLYWAGGYAPQLLTVASPGEIRLLYQLGDECSSYRWSTGDRPVLYEYTLTDQEAGERLVKIKPAKYWNLLTGEQIGRQQKIAKEQIIDNQLSADGAYLATIVSVVTGTYTGGPTYAGVTASADLATEQVLRIDQLSDGEELYHNSIPGLEKINFSPQASYLYATLYNGKVLILPLNLVDIHSYYVQADKNRYLLQMGTQSDALLQERMAEWELDQGVNFQNAANFAYFIAHETPFVRSNYARYLIDQAWLTNEKNRRENLVKQALRCNLLDNGQIRNTHIDSLSASMTYLELTYFQLAGNNLAGARRELARAQAVGLQSQRIRQLEVLIDWQAGKTAPAFRALLQRDRLLLLEEYENLRQRDISLNNKALFNRFMANAEGKADPVENIMEEPRMARLVADYPPDLQIAFLQQYYRNNEYHSSLNLPESNSKFNTEALAFLEKHFDYNTTTDPYVLDQLATYNSTWSALALEQGDLPLSLQYAEKSARARRALLATDPENPTNQDNYLLFFSEYLYLKMQVYPEKATAMLQEIAEVEQTVETQQSIPWQARKGLCALLADQPMLAYRSYLAALEQTSTSAYLTTDRVAEIVEKEVLEIAPLAQAAFTPVLSSLNKYVLARYNYFQQVDDLANFYIEEDAALVGFGETFAAYWTAAQDYQAITRELEKAAIVTADQLPILNQDIALVGGENTLVLLRNGYFDQARTAAGKALERVPSLVWPRAVEAIWYVINGDWPAAQELLDFDLRNAPNDGLDPETYPEMRDFLLDLPTPVLENANYQKNAARWQAILNQ